MFASGCHSAAYVPMRDALLAVPARSAGGESDDVAALGGAHRRFRWGLPHSLLLKILLKILFLYSVISVPPQEQFFKLADFKGAHLFLPELDAAMIFYFSKNGA